MGAWCAVWQELRPLGCFLCSLAVSCSPRVGSCSSRVGSRAGCGQGGGGFRLCRHGDQLEGTLFWRWPSTGSSAMGLCILLGGGNLGFFFGVPLGFHIAPKQNYIDRGLSTGSGFLSLVVAWLESPAYGLLRNSWVLEHKSPPGGALLPQNSCWKGEFVEHGPSAPGTWH